MVLVTAEGELASELGAAPGGALLAERLLSLPSVVDSATRFLNLPVRTITAVEHCVCVMQENSLHSTCAVRLHLP